ncbi:MAG: DMT family transporter [Paracoccaceae bacterium]
MTAAAHPVTRRDAANLLGAAALYGGVFPINRLAAEAGWPAVAFALWPAAAAGFALLLLVLLRGEARAVGRRHLVAWLALGGLVIGAPIGILVEAAKHLDASILTLVLCLSPILTLVIAASTGSEPFDRRVLLGMLLGTAGIALIVWPESGVIVAGNVKWFLLALIAPAMFALANNCAVWLRPPAASALVMATGTLLGGALIAVIIALAIGAPLAPAEPGAGHVPPFVLASLLNTLFYPLFFLIVAAIGAARFSIFNYLAVAAGILWSMAAFGEAPAPAFWAAGTLMLLGMHIALRPRASVP